MFTIDQIKGAHARVKSGADFPRYVQEIKALGVTSYDHYVSDGHTAYYGADGFVLNGEAKWPSMEIAAQSSIAMLQKALSVHQQGQTDYLTFCSQSAEAGVEKWTVDITGLKCTYYNKAGEKMIEEEIPVS